MDEIDQILRCGFQSRILELCKMRVQILPRFCGYRRGQLESKYLDPSTADYFPDICSLNIGNSLMLITVTKLNHLIYYLIAV